MLHDLEKKISDIGALGVANLKAFIGHIKKAPAFMVDNEYI